jgi:hypothetical protein
LWISIIKYGQKNLGKTEINNFFIFVISAFFIWLALKNYKLINLIYIVICFLILVIIATLAIADIDWNPNYGRYKSYLVFGIFYACLFVFIILIIKNKIIIHDVRLGLFFVFLIIPFIFAMGSNNNTWIQSGSASFFG